MDIFKTPRDAAVAAQRNPVLWPGTDERFTGYGVMGLPFRSGHYLAMRHVPASSIGPECRTVWHYAPDGTCTFITDRRPEHTCARYFAPGDSALTLYADIASKWDGPHSLRVTVPDMLDWRIELGSTAPGRNGRRTPATVMMTALSHRLPPIAWHSNAFQRVVNAVAAALLRAGRVGMSGTAPNGQRFAWGPRRIWKIASSHAVLHGVDLGPPHPLPRQLHLVDFWLPQRGLFAVGDSAFENFGPTQHALPSAPKVKSQTGRKDS